MVSEPRVWSGKRSRGSGMKSEVRGEAGGEERIWDVGRRDGCCWADREGFNPTLGLRVRIYSYSITVCEPGVFR